MSTAIWPGLLTGLVFASVIRGREPDISEFPFQVFIQNATNKIHLCGGIIITSKWVLTVRDCAIMSTSVLVGYGSSDSNQPMGVISSKRIIYDSETSAKITPLALIELENNITFTDTIKPARLPTKNARFQGYQAKITGWKLDSIMHKHPTLIVMDRCKLELTDCKRPEGTPVPLNPDQFCGFEEDFPEYFSLKDLGTAVSKGGILVGLLPKVPDNLVSPIIFVKVSEHGDWISTKMEKDAEKLSWVDTIPKDSAPAASASALLSCLVLSLLARFA